MGRVGAAGDNAAMESFFGLLQDLARIAGTRWAVEECFQQAKGQAGLDEYQVRDWRAWYAHITLSMAAYAWLVVARTLTGSQQTPPVTA